MFTFDKSKYFMRIINFDYELMSEKTIEMLAFGNGTKLIAVFVLVVKFNINSRLTLLYILWKYMYYNAL